MTLREHLYVVAFAEVFRKTKGIGARCYDHAMYDDYRDAATQVQMAMATWDTQEIFEKANGLAQKNNPVKQR